MNLATLILLLIIAMLALLAVRRIRRKKLLFSCGGTAPAARPTARTESPHK